MKKHLLVVVATVVSFVSGCTMAPSRAYDEWRREPAVAQSSGGTATAANGESEELRRSHAENRCRRNHLPETQALAECLRDDAQGGAHVPAAPAAQAQATPQPAAPTEVPRPMPYIGGMPYNGMGFMAQPAVPALPGTIGGHVPVIAPPAWRQSIENRSHYAIAVSVDNVFLPLRGPAITATIRLADGSTPTVAVAPVTMANVPVEFVTTGSDSYTFTAICIGPDGREAGRFVRRFSTTPGSWPLPGIMENDCVRQ